MTTAEAAAEIRLFGLGKHFQSTLQRSARTTARRTFAPDATTGTGGISSEFDRADDHRRRAAVDDVAKLSGLVHARRAGADLRRIQSGPGPDANPAGKRRPALRQQPVPRQPLRISLAKTESIARTYCRGGPPWPPVRQPPTITFNNVSFSLPGRHHQRARRFHDDDPERKDRRDRRPKRRRQKHAAQTSLPLLRSRRQARSRSTARI